MTRRKRHRRVSPERAAERARRREELLEASERVIQRDGPNASMDDIAAEAGITKPILYRHFGDRAGLIGALGERFADELTSELSVALTRPGPPREILASTIDAFVSFIEVRPQMYQFLTFQAFPTHPEDMVGVIRRVSQQVALVLGEGLRQAGLDSGAAEPWAHAIVGAVHLSGHWWVERPTMPRTRLVEYLTTLLWDGLKGVGVPETQTFDFSDAAPDAPAASTRTRRRASP